MGSVQRLLEQRLCSLWAAEGGADKAVTIRHLGEAQTIFGNLLQFLDIGD